MLQLALGIIKPDEGEITTGIWTKDTAATRFRDVISYLPYDNFLSKSISLNQAEEDAGAEGIPFDKERFAQLKERFSFEKFANKKLNKCSGGERKIANLIYALSKPCRVLALDEPFAPLDRHAKKVLADELLALSKTHLILLVDHSGSIAEENCASVFDFSTLTQRFVASLPEEEKDVVPASYPSFSKKNNISSIRVQKHYRRSYFSVSLLLGIISFLCFGSWAITQETSPLTVAEMNAFIAKNDPHHYLPVSERVEEDHSIPSFPADSDNAYFLFGKSDFLSTGANESRIQSQLGLLAVDDIKEDNTIYCSSSCADLIVTEYKDSTLPVTFSSTRLEIGQTGDDYAIISLDSTVSLKSFEEAKISLLYCSKATFTKLVEDCFFHHIEDKDGMRIQATSAYTTYVSGSSSLANSATRNIVFLEGKNKIALKGAKEGQSIYIAHNPFTVTDTNDALASNEIGLSYDVFLHLCQFDASIKGTSLGILASTHQPEALGNSFLYFSTLDAYQREPLVQTFHVTSLILGIGMTLILLFYLPFSGWQTRNRRRYAKLIYLGFSKKERHRICFTPHAVAITIAFALAAILVSFIPTILNHALVTSETISNILVGPYAGLKTAIPTYVALTAYPYFIALGIAILILAIAYLVTFMSIRDYDRA